MFAKEGADVAISYLSEHKDAEETRRLLEEPKRECRSRDLDLVRIDPLCTATMARGAEKCARLAKR